LGLFNVFQSRKKIDRIVKSVASKGSQKTLDTQAYQPKISPMFGVQVPQDLDTMRTYYLSSWISRRAVNSLIRLTLSDIEPNSNDDELNAKVIEFCKSINLRSMLVHLLRQVFVYGFGMSELVYDRYPNPTEMTGIHVCDSRSMRVDIEITGSVRRFIQLPNMLHFVVPIGGMPIEIEPQLMLHIVRDPIGDQHYGSSLYQAIETNIKSIGMLEIAMSKAALRAATAPEFFSYQADPDGHNEEEATEALNALAKAYDSAEPGDPLFAANPGEWKRQQGQSKPMPMVNEHKALVGAAISGCDLSPAAMGIPFFSTSLHEASEQRVVLLSMIENLQSQIVEQLNSKLFSQLSELWQTDLISISMKPPTLMSEKERAEKDTITINNEGLMLKMGLESPTGAANALGFDEPFDDELLDKWIEGGQTQQEMNDNTDNDPAQVDQTQEKLKDNTEKTQ